MRPKTKLLLLAHLVAAAAAAHGQTVLTHATWYAESSADTGVVLDPGENSIEVTNTSGSHARAGGVAALDLPVSLDSAGDYIEFVGEYSGSIGNNENYSIRVGFYNAEGLTIDADFHADMDSLVGHFGGVATRSTEGARSGILSHASGTSYVLGLDAANASGNGVSLIGDWSTEISTGVRTITFRIERLAGDVLELSLDDGELLALTRTQDVSEAPVVAYDTVAVGFALGDNASADFSDILVTTNASAPSRGARATVDLSVITGCDESVFPSVFDTEIYVDPAAGDDANDGLSPTTAVRTLQRAGQRALEHNALDESVRVNLLPGHYDDEDDFMDLLAGGTAQPIVIEATEPGSAILYGSDVWTGWTDEGSGVYSKHWSHNWGPTDESWVPGWVKADSSGSQVDNELLQRREQVIINGNMQLQVLSSGDLVSVNPVNGEGTFFVDEENDRIYVAPPPGVDPDTDLVEVSVRPVSMRDAGNRPENVFFIERDNIALIGIVARHHALGVRSVAALRNASNVLIENCDFSYTPWAGLDFSFGVNQNITVRNSVFNWNGGLGIVGGGDGLKNLVIEDTVLNWNNMRGESAGTTGWGTAGIKLAKTHDARLTRVTANWNRANGIWQDLEGKNMVWEECVADYNRRYGMDFEVLQGPLLLRDSRFVNNRAWQIAIAATQDLTIDGIVAWRDTEGAVEFSSNRQIRGSLSVWQQSRTETDWDTGEPLYLLPLYTTIVNSAFRETDGRLYNRWGSGSGGDPELTYENWIGTLYSNFNHFYKADMSLANGNADDDPAEWMFNNKNNQRRPLDSTPGYNDFWRNFSGEADGVFQDLDSTVGDFAPDDRLVLLPARPSDLLAQAVDETEVYLQWSDNSTNEDTYVVEYSDDGGATFSTAATLPAGSTSATVSGLTGGTGYVFRVLASNTAGASQPSFGAFVSTPAPPVFSVAGIAFAIIDEGNGYFRHEATVTVVDEDSSPVEGAWIEGSFTSGWTGSAGATSNAQGEAVIVSASFKPAFCVDFASHPDKVYDPDGNSVSCSGE
ncbi:MAG: right-handed parallel beta-helix repeat-containing protein [Opitutales bacterium]|nr:right-handed parallel beta-helix repeat-containing protein [Opitutales bacterium]